MWNLLAGPITSLASTWLKGRVERSAAKTKAEVQAKLTEAAILEKKATADIDWDIEQAKGSQTSLKDEWLCLLFSIPLILAWIPGCEGIVERGFAELEKMPDWYMYSLGIIVAASFGMRSATKFFGRQK